jgi:hypothetical protein
VSLSILSSVVGVIGIFSVQAQDAPVSLGRVFAKNEKLAYDVKSSLHSEHKMRGLDTWIPEDLDLNYGFTTVVEAMKADGIAVVRYQRPIMHEIEGETFNAPPQDHVIKSNLDLRLTVSPINEILEMKDLAPKTPKPEAESGSELLRFAGGRRQKSTTGILGQFVSEMYRLSLFAGSFESSLDFAPKTPVDPVKVGETWKHTVGYQPQALKGKGNKQAVQRLDYTFTYKGIVESEGKKVYRVEGSLDLKTDLGDFVNQLVGMKPEDTGLKKVPLHMKSTIEFDLDMKTRTTILAQAVTECGFGLYVTAYPDEAVQEDKVKAHTTMRLVGQKIIQAPAKKGR